MGTFSHFLATLHPDTRIRGTQFEHFVKWFLKNDPEWATQVDQVWLWIEYPGRCGRDCGIGLVFKDKAGATWAVQANPVKIILRLGLSPRRTDPLFSLDHGT